MFEPSVEAIKARYYAKFSKGGKVPEEEEEEQYVSLPSNAPAPAPVPAPAPAASRPRHGACHGTRHSRPRHSLRAPLPPGWVLKLDEL